MHEPVEIIPGPRPDNHYMDSVAETTGFHRLPRPQNCTMTSRDGNRPLNMNALCYIWWTKSETQQAATCRCSLLKVPQLRSGAYTFLTTGPYRADSLHYLRILWPARGLTDTHRCISTEASLRGEETYLTCSRHSSTCVDLSHVHVYYVHQQS